MAVTVLDFAAVVAEATAAGMAALVAAKPTPMVVGQATSLFGNEIDYSKPTYYEPEGACGFAWVHFAGNTAFGKWMKKMGYARDDYPKGLCVWVREGGQSIERKEAYAAAYAKVLKAHGIEAYADSRLD